MQRRTALHNLLSLYVCFGCLWQDIITTYEQSLMRFTTIRDNIYDLHSSLFNMINDEQMNVLLVVFGKTS